MIQRLLTDRTKSLVAEVQKLTDALGSADSPASVKATVSHAPVNLNAGALLRDKSARRALRPKKDEAVPAVTPKLTTTAHISSAGFAPVGAGVRSGLWKTLYADSERQAAVKGAMKHAWDSYERYAFGMGALY